MGSTKVGAPRTCVPRSATGCAPKGRAQVGHFLYCATTTGRQPLQTRAWPHAKRTSRGASSQMMHTRASSAAAATDDDDDDTAGGRAAMVADGEATYLLSADAERDTVRLHALSYDDVDVAVAVRSLGELRNDAGASPCALAAQPSHRLAYVLCETDRRCEGNGHEPSRAEQS